MGDKKQIAILGGSTISWLSSHCGITAGCHQGTTAKRLKSICEELIPEMDPVLYLTKTAGGAYETNEDIERLIDGFTHGNAVKIVFFTAAMADFNVVPFDLPDNVRCDVDKFIEEENEIGSELGLRCPSDEVVNACKYGYERGYENCLENMVDAKAFDCDDFEGDKYGVRLSSNKQHNVTLVPAKKVINDVRKHRKDIFLVGFKQTCGLSEGEQYIKGLELCKKASCNLVFANDVKTRVNMVITPEEARYHVTTDREEALRGLVTMAKLRSHLSFTRSTVVAGEPVPWDSPLVPDSLRKVVDYCISQNAYKPFNGATVGHFACKLNENEFLTSIRRTNFNDLSKTGLVRVEADGPDTVLAYGARPSVGGQSQRIIFGEHEGMDAIVHFHCPIREGSEVPVRSQYEFECGSMACGKNTSDGLKQFGNLKAVYLDQHGPNIVFSKSINPQEVIDFIDKNFDLSQKTGGFVTIKERLETPSTLETAVNLLQ